MERREFISAVATVAAGGVALGGAKWLPGRGYSVTAIPERVGAPEVARVRTMTTELRRLGQQHGGGAMLDAAEGFAGHAERMLGARMTQGTGKQLRLAMGELHTMIGWTHHDAGRPVAVRRHYYRALTLARDAAEPELTADALADLAHVATENGDADSGVKLARIGLTASTSGVSSATVANLHIEEARAWARLGDERAMLGALHQAEYELAQADLDAVPDYATIGRDLASGSAVFEGRRLQVYELLSRVPSSREYAEKAAPLGEALARMDDGDHRRRVLICRVSLAAAQLRTGEAAGMDTAYEVIEQSGSFQSYRARSRLNDLALATGNNRARDMVQLRAKVAELTRPQDNRTHPADGLLRPAGPRRRGRPTTSG